MDIDVQHNRDQSRYEAHLGGEIVGYAEYTREADQVTFTHTVVELEGKGVGSALARHALDAVRAEGSVYVVPECSFIKGWIEKHPDYQDLVAGA